MWNLLSNISFYESILLKQQEEIDLNFEHMCRSCLRDASDTHNLDKDYELGGTPFNLDGEALKLADMLATLTGLQVTASDPFPHQICNNCIENIGGAYLFRLQCLRADKLLKRLHQAFDTGQIIENDLEKAEKEVVSKKYEYMPITPNIIEICTENEVDEIDDLDKQNDDITEKDICIEFDEGRYNIDSEIFQVDHEIEFLKLDGNTIENREYTNQLFEANDRDHAEPQEIQIEILNIDNCSYQTTTIEEVAKRKKNPNTTDNVHHTDGPNKKFNCDVCDAKFTKVQSLNRHMKIHQADQKNKICMYCDKAFIRADDLTRHTRIHTGERPYACKICSKRYKQTSELKEHILSHSKERRFICTTCGKVLKTRNGHYVHMRTHMGLKKHICELCGNSYVTSGELTSHIRHIHEKKKPFRCRIDDCSRAFTTKHSLGIHERAHTGERPFVCSYCSKKISSKSSLVAHLRLHEESNPYTCHICNKTTRTQQMLKKHIQLHDDSEKELLQCSICRRYLKNYAEMQAHANEQCTEGEQF